MYVCMYKDMYIQWNNSSEKKENKYANTIVSRYLVCSSKGSVSEYMYVYVYACTCAHTHTYLSSSNIQRRASSLRLRTHTQTTTLVTACLLTDSVCTMSVVLQHTSTKQQQNAQNNNTPHQYKTFCFSNFIHNKTHKRAHHISEHETSLPTEHQKNQVQHTNTPV